MARKITVLSPEGIAPSTDAKELAPRLETLEDKVVFLVDVGYENSDVFIDQLSNWFSHMHPHVRVIREHLENPFEPRPDVYEKIGATGDAAIFGVGL
ncbi:MAG: UGSC family (seleno)protein [Acidimicrobiales bacterium]